MVFPSQLKAGLAIQSRASYRFLHKDHQITTFHHFPKISKPLHNFLTLSNISTIPIIHHFHHGDEHETTITIPGFLPQESLEGRQVTAT